VIGTVADGTSKSGALAAVSFARRHAALALIGRVPDRLRAQVRRPRAGHAFVPQRTDGRLSGHDDAA